MNRYHILASDPQLGNVRPLVAVSDDGKCIFVFTSIDELSKYVGVEGLGTIDVPKQHLIPMLQQLTQSDIAYVSVDHADQILITDYVAQL